MRIPASLCLIRGVLIYLHANGERKTHMNGGGTIQNKFLSPPPPKKKVRKTKSPRERKKESKKQRKITMSAVTVDVQPIVYTTDQTPTPVPNHAAFIWPFWMSEMEFSRCVQSNGMMCARGKGAGPSICLSPDVRPIVAYVSYAMFCQQVSVFLPTF